MGRYSKKMKTIVKVVSLVLLLLVQYQYGQRKEYEVFYNEAVPKLRELASKKQSYYNKEFSIFYKDMKNRNLVVKEPMTDAKNGERSSELYVLRLYLTDEETQSFTYHQKLANPYIYVLFKERIPNNIREILKKYHWTWNEELAEYFSKYTIEEMEFYGLEGINVRYHEPR